MLEGARQPRSEGRRIDKQCREPLRRLARQTNNLDLGNILLRGGLQRRGHVIANGTALHFGGAPDLGQQIGCDPGIETADLTGLLRIAFSHAETVSQFAGLFKFHKSTGSAAFAFAKLTNLENQRDSQKSWSSRKVSSAIAANLRFGLNRFRTRRADLRFRFGSRDPSLVSAKT